MKNIILPFAIIILMAFFMQCKQQPTVPKKGQEKTDSLFSVLEKAKTDTSKVNTLNAIAYEYRSTNPDTAFIFANDALSLATKLDHKMGIADAYLYLSMALSGLGKSEEALKDLNNAIGLYDQLLISEENADKNKIKKRKANVYNTIGFINMNLQSNYPEALKNHSTALDICQKIGDKPGIALATFKIGMVYLYQGNYMEALKYDSSALKMYQELGDKQFTANSFFNMGLVYDKMSNYPEALKQFSTALNIFQEIDDKEYIGRTYNSIGSVYKSLGNFPESMKYCLAALKVNEEIGDKKRIAEAYNSIGRIYLNQKPCNYVEALKNFNDALKIYRDIDNKKGAAGCLCNIGIVYYYQGKNEEALYYFLASLKLCEEIGAKDFLANNYNNIGNVYNVQENYPEALKNYLTALKIFEEIKNKIGITNSYLHLGDVYTNMKNYNRASDYLNKGLLLAKEIGSLNDIKYSYDYFERLNSKTGNYKKALEHYKLYITYRDSLYNEENTKKITQQQMQYEFDKKETATKAEQDKKDALAIKELQKQKLVRNGFIGGFAIVLLFAIVFFGQRIRISKEKKRSEALLLNILPSEVAEELKQKGSALAKQFDDVTVIFTDFKGFTQIAEKLTPVELVAEIDICFKAFDNIMGKYNIEKIKTIGDSYMAAGGLPVPNKTNASDVVNAALEIQQFMQTYCQQKKNQGKEIFEMRIGVHTGPVVAGIVGVKKFAYDIWGDTVNIASRMESSGEAGKVNISGSTYEIVKDKFTCNYRGKVKAKNKGEIDMYFVESIQNKDSLKKNPVIA